MRDSLVGTTEIQEIAKVNVPIRRRERVLILSVDPALEEDTIKEEVEKCIQGSSSEDTVSGLKGKLHASDIDPATKKMIESIIQGTKREIKIIRKIETKQGKINWLLEVDEEGKRILLELKRICLDFDRYRVVEYVSITRCYRCQKYGHLSVNCTEEPHCAKCASSEHAMKDGKSEEETCSNCYFEDNEGDCKHRADSNVCPVFQNYRRGLMANRS